MKRAGESKDRQVDDLVISPGRALSTVIANVGGFVGLGKRLVAKPVERFAHARRPRPCCPSQQGGVEGLAKFDDV